jgi:superfamily II RNA helicase
MNSKQLIKHGVPKDFSLSPCETLKLHDAMKTISNDISLPTLTESFSPDWVIERSICNNYSRLVCKQFDRLIETKDQSNIDTITTNLRPITSKTIQYPQPKDLTQLIIDFILTLKEKNLLPCIVFSDSRILCETMAASVAKYFKKVEEDLRATKYRQQIEELNRRVESIEIMRKKSKPKKEKKSSGKRNNNDDDHIEELKMMEDDRENQILLSGFEQQLLNGILDEGSLANRHGCDGELVDALLGRASKDNSRLIEYMKRGVAYHHAGLNNKGRVAVEALFRNRYIQVVFSTATLGMSPNI